jgi:hypothetical protein
MVEGSVANAGRDSSFRHAIRRTTDRVRATIRRCVSARN